MINLLIGLVLCFLCSFFGYVMGVDDGRLQVFTGEFVCKIVERRHMDDLTVCFKDPN